MITRDEMLPLIVEACPSFAPAWKKFIDEWKDEGGDPLYYFALADLARHLIFKLESDDTAEFAAVFAVIELLHTDGEHYVREAATVGFLEALQNLGLHTSTKPEQFRRYLLPESERWWDKLYGFWGDGEQLTND